jgi:hypothetical protein
LQTLSGRGLRQAFTTAMHLIQLLLPLYSNSGVLFEKNLYVAVRKELVAKFGGMTAYTRAPADGLWQESDHIVRDDLVIYEIMVEGIDQDWWRDYRTVLEERFQQTSLPGEEIEAAKGKRKRKAG